MAAGEGAAPARGPETAEASKPTGGKDRIYRVVVQMTAIFLAILGIILVLWLKPEALKFWEFTRDDIVRLFTELFIVALIIERGVEVFITPWRQGDRDKLEMDLQHAKKAATPEVELQKHQALSAYKHETCQVAFLSSLGIGIVVSAAGIRVLQFLVQPQTLEKIANTNQGLVFAGLDVLLTGALLGGGADGLHKVVSVFTNFMDATASKAAAKP